MYFLDSQRTITRRDSSLIVPRLPKRCFIENEEGLSTARAQSTARLISESSTSITPPRPKGSIRRELVTMMFESMLDCIVESWDVIVAQEKEESVPVAMDFGRSPSDVAHTGRKKKHNSSIVKNKATSKKSRSKVSLNTLQMQVDPLQQCWWSSPDERAVIRFKNGNLYEGSISMKCMHGEGRFQWADGTVYSGQFKENEMTAKGVIFWKDDTWYQGEFSGNLRHGKGLYVDSRLQRSYCGGWYCGTKHGAGVIYYNGMNNSYDGEWVYNIRHGFGSREYGPDSGYNGEWDTYVREGKGLMIWPNHDFYRGDWKNGVMSGRGLYIWDAHYNNTLSLPSTNTYQGDWVRGERNGYGDLKLGHGLGSQYTGEFRNNKKHGAGTLITNDGLIVQNRMLFVDDNISLLPSESKEKNSTLRNNNPHPHKPYKFDNCDSSSELLYHVELALKNIDRQAETRANIINDYIENNKSFRVKPTQKKESVESANVHNIEDVILFEEMSLRKALKCYITDLMNIYHKYGTIFNTEEISFTPILIRLNLWQLYYDCNIHEKGLTLVEIDRLFHRNPKWLARTAHNPFEKIYFWQFQHSLISVASRLYAKREMPGTKSDTILASAFRKFMEVDVLPAVGRRKGRLANGFASIIPLKGTYDLYRCLGEPHSVRTFLCAVRGSLGSEHTARLVEVPESVMGRNAYVCGEELAFITDEVPCTPQEDQYMESIAQEYKLFNFSNLSIRAIIQIFSKIFPQITVTGKVIDLEVKITFFEFFEAFIACAEESILLKDEEMKWRSKFGGGSIEFSVPPPTPNQISPLSTKKI